MAAAIELFNLCWASEATHKLQVGPCLGEKIAKDSTRISVCVSCSFMRCATNMVAFAFKRSSLNVRWNLTRPRFGAHRFDLYWRRVTMTFDSIQYSPIFALVSTPQRTLLTFMGKSLSVSQRRGFRLSWSDSLACNYWRRPFEAALKPPRPRDVLESRLPIFCTALKHTGLFYLFFTGTQVWYIGKQTDTDERQNIWWAR